MHIKNSEISEYSGSVAHIGLRQICDLTNLKGCKFGVTYNKWGLSKKFLKSKKEKIDIFHSSKISSKMFYFRVE